MISLAFQGTVVGEKRSQNSLKGTRSFSNSIFLFSYDFGEVLAIPQHLFYVSVLTDKPAIAVEK